MGLNNIVKPKGFEIELLGETYTFQLKLASSIYLGEKYGTAKKAYEKMFQIWSDLTTGDTAKDGIPPDAYRIILDFLYAGICHNKDKEIPSVDDMIDEMLESDFTPLLAIVTKGMQAALPDPKPVVEDASAPKNLT